MYKRAKTSKIKYLKQCNKKKSWKTLKIREINNQPIHKVQLPNSMRAKKGKQKMD